MSERNSLDQAVNRGQRIAFLVAGVGLALGILAAILNLDQFLKSYLVGFLFWWSVTVGCMGLLMLTYLVGGYWSEASKPLLEAGSLLAPLTAGLFLPVAWGVDSLYPWTDPKTISAGKTLYLNPGFFYLRALIYFLAWSGLAGLLCFPRRASTEGPRWRRLLSAGGLVLLILTISFAAIDWGMSLDPEWFSSIYGALVAIGGALAGLALVTFTLATLENHQRPETSLVSSDTLADLGTLTLAFLMLWAYFAFSQFLIIWSGNLPEENFWYITRMESGWQWVGLAIVVFQFFLPFFLLLSRERKRNPSALAAVTALLFGMQLINLFWMVSPSFHPENLFVHWADIVVPIAIGGVWVSGFLWLLGSRLTELKAKDAL